MSKLLREKLKRSSRYSPLLPTRNRNVSSLDMPVDIRQDSEKDGTLLADTIESEKNSTKDDRVTGCASQSLFKSHQSPINSATEENQSSLKRSIDFSDSCTNNSSNESVNQEILRLKDLVHIKEEKLRKLKLVKMYRSKNNLEELQSLIDKWRTVAQEALYHLMDLNRESGVSLTDLVNYFSLDHKLLGFNVDDESFT